ncbi:MAG: tRNA (adenosine(37)-N6)-threonylcarbamoyltransferase complex dimerization subunit type 1 TsaB [Hyphomicrobiaceae bacterium]
MRILAFDATLGTLSVAYCDQGAPEGSQLVEDTTVAAASHAERLMPMIQGVLAKASVAFADIDRVAISLGPGTFTGVRTGIAAARAFRLAAGTEVVGLTSLAVIAAQAFDSLAQERGHRPILVVIDARRDRLYCQLFGDSPLNSLAGPAELSPDDLVAFCGNRPCLAVGSGLLREDVMRTLAKSPIVMCKKLEALEPRAADLAALAPRLTPLDVISPIYIRPPDAKPPSKPPL